MNKVNKAHILDHLAKASEQETPDGLEYILRRCEQIDRERQTGRGMQPMEDTDGMPLVRAFPRRGRMRSPAWVRWAASAAAMIAVISGARLGIGYYTVDSVIGFDVNPSVELKVNSGERVLSAVPLNADAAVILDGMNLKNVDLDVAVNALIGSMLKNGYVSEIKNSVLISVENTNAVKSADLQRRLSDEVSSLLGAFSVEGAVLSQALPEDESLKALAAEHGVSPGKAALVEQLVSQDTRFLFEDIAALPINDISLLIADKQADIQGVSLSGQASSGAYIGELKAEEIALSGAGIVQASVTGIKAKLDFDDGRMVYEVEFYTAEAEYEYEIDAVTGDILEYDLDIKADKTRDEPSRGDGGESAQGAPQPAVDGEDIGEARAESIALTHAGLTESAVSHLSVSAKRDDGRDVYEVEFKNGKIEYEYEIDATDGTVIEWDSDYDD